MRETDKLKLPYPELSDAPNVPADVQRLAETLDTIIPNLETGNWSALTECTVANANWEVTYFRGSKSYYLVSIIIGIYYRGTTAIKGDSNGNVSDQHIATLTRAALRPQISAIGLMVTADSMLHVHIDSAGKIWLRGLANGGQSVSKNEGCNLTISYPSVV